MRYAIEWKVIGGKFFEVKDDWVDPMEPQIHFDGPGKSRMNMDLVPVYEDTTKGQSPSIKISSAVINNLGVRTAIVE
ncbi:MAG: hypothetical protein K2X53_00075 [Alphaproteobacteria bacterium]|nr:hypothetical protein [Alphaproteobacteria bacterium]